MFGVLPLSPAYGRDYKSIKEFEIDFHKNLDFLTSNNQYINKDQILDLQLAKIQVRFGKMRKTAVINTAE